MHVIVGLGNPGPQYRATRHNVGFMVIDCLVERHARGVVPRAAFNAAIVDSRLPEIGGQSDARALFVKPLNFMNRSGSTVADVVNFYKLDLERLLVIVDDAALPLGHLRFRAGGSDGGHNGLADIALRLGTMEYPRLRVGIGQSDLMTRRDYVLGRFTEEQLVDLEPALDRAADAVFTWRDRGMTQAMNEYNTPADRPPTGPTVN